VRRDTGCQSEIARWISYASKSSTATGNFTPPGDRHFTNDRPSSFAGSGTIGDGYFALFLSEITVKARLCEYQGEE
jgi:hypothetical protein